MPREQPSPLARYLFFAYVLLVIYASLHPFSGWRDQGLPPFAFLTAPLPRFISAFDVIANVVGYVPLGFLAVLALYPRQRGGAALAIGILCALSLSFALESLQHYLPSRRSSNLDSLANIAGACWGGRRTGRDPPPAARAGTADAARPAVSPRGQDRPRPGAARAVVRVAAQSRDASVRRRRPARTFPDAFGRTLSGRAVPARRSRGRWRQYSSGGTSRGVPGRARTARAACRRRADRRGARGAQLRFRLAVQFAGHPAMGDSRCALRRGGGNPCWCCSLPACRGRRSSRSRGSR